MSDRIIIEIKRTTPVDKFVPPEALHGALYSGENLAHRFIIRRSDDEAYAGIVTAKFLRYANSTTVPLTGSIEDGAATVTLIKNCYDLPGRFKLTVYVTAGGSTTTIYCCTGTVDRTDGSVTIDPGGEINLDVTDLINRIDEAAKSIPPEYSALSGEVAQLSGVYNYYDPKATYTQTNKGGATRDGYTINADGSITSIRSMGQYGQLFLVDNNKTIGPGKYIICGKMTLTGETPTSNQLIVALGRTVSYSTVRMMTTREGGTAIPVGEKVGWFRASFELSAEEAFAFECIPTATSMIDSTHPCTIESLMIVAGEVLPDYSPNTFTAEDKIARQDISGLKSSVGVLEPAATASDVGKMLKAKSVVDGKVTEYEFGEGVVVDSSLSHAGEAADSAAVGNAIATLNTKTLPLTTLVNVGYGSIADHVYLEEGDAGGSKLFFKLDRVCFHTGSASTSSYYDKTWARIKTDLNATGVTSPGGVADCLECPNDNALVFDRPEEKMKFVPRNAIQKGQIPLFFNAYGRADNLHPTLIGAKIFQIKKLIQTTETNVQAANATAQAANANAQAANEAAVDARSAVDALRESLAPAFTPSRPATASGRAVVIPVGGSTQIGITPAANTDIYVSGKNMLRTYTLNKYYTSSGTLADGNGNAVSPVYRGITGESYTISANKTLYNIGIITFNASGTRVRRYNNYTVSQTTVTLETGETSFACWLDESSDETARQTDAGFMALQPQVEHGAARTSYESGVDPVKYTGTAGTAMSVAAPAAKHALIQGISSSLNVPYTTDTEMIFDVYNVKAYGAIGDGIVDDTRAIQNALNDAYSAGGGTVFMPAGTYLINTSLFDASNSGVASALHIYDNTTLEMDSGAILKRGANINHMIFTHNDSGATGYTGAKNIVIRGGTIDENAELSSNETAVNLSHAFNVLIENVVFKGSASGSWHYIEVNSSDHVLIRNCTFETGANSEDIQIDAAVNTGNLGQSDGTVCQNIEISGCYFNSGAHPAIGNHTDGAHHDIRIHDCVFYNNNSRGAIAWVALTHAVDIYGCTFYENTYGANFAASQTDSIFRDNRLSDVTTPARNCTACDNVIDGVFVRT